MSGQLLPGVATAVRHPNRSKSPYEQMKHRLEELLTRSVGQPMAVPFEEAHAWTIPPRLTKDIPKKWEKHGDLILLPSNAFSDPFWETLGADMWRVVGECLNCRRLARKKTVSTDGFRSSQVELIVGDDGWVEHNDNGVRYSYDVTKCMFSAGNITEKLRIANMNCSEQVVVDMYAGIGYFTLPYLIHASAVHVHACEWNPNAVEALKRNLTLNKVEDRCTVHFGDNRIVCPVGVADRVNLGLIPSCEAGLETACRALKKATGGVLHVHGNVTSYSKEKDCRAPGNVVELEAEPQGKWTKKARTRPEWTQWAENICERLREILRSMYPEALWEVSLLHTEYVKSYAPRISHLVADVRCVPSS